MLLLNDLPDKGYVTYSIDFNSNNFIFKKLITEIKKYSPNNFQRRSIALLCLNNAVSREIISLIKRYINLKNLPLISNYDIEECNVRNIIRIFLLPNNSFCFVQYPLDNSSVIELVLHKDFLMMYND